MSLEVASWVGGIGLLGFLIAVLRSHKFSDRGLTILSTFTGALAFVGLWPFLAILTTPSRSMGPIVFGQLTQYSLAAEMYKEEHLGPLPLLRWEDAMRPYLTRPTIEPNRIGLNARAKAPGLNQIYLAPTLNEGPNAILRTEADLLLVQGEFFAFGWQGERIYGRTVNSRNPVIIPPAWGDGRTVDIRAIRSDIDPSAPLRRWANGMGGAALIVLMVLVGSVVQDEVRRMVWIRILLLLALIAGLTSLLPVASR